MSNIVSKFQAHLGRFYPPSSIANVFAVLLISGVLNLILLTIQFISNPALLNSYFTSTSGLITFVLGIGSTIIRFVLSLSLYKGSKFAYMAIFVLTALAILSSVGGFSILTLLFNVYIMYLLLQPQSRSYCSIKY